ncbi:MAG: membrane protein insertion efficiency factor YidD [Gemmatimonadetes bacterium]|nr:membrane protein insertion efficiency factor YidD [Gemmatimonadota bacterium]
MQRVTIWPLRALVLIYRYTLSPLLGPRCRFYPSCSHYAEQALASHGWRGVWLAAKRVLRCHPWNAGGVDPVPPRTVATRAPAPKG